MHQPMLDRNVEQAVDRKPVTLRTRRFQTSVREFLIQRRPDFSYVLVHSLECGPIRRLVGGQSAPHWIDAEGKQAVKFGMKTIQTQDVFVQQVPIKCLQMPDIKDDA